MELGAYALISNGQLALQRIPHKDHCLDFGAEQIFLLDGCVAHDGDVFRPQHQHHVCSRGDTEGQNAAQSPASGLYFAESVWACSRVSNPSFDEIGQTDEVSHEPFLRRLINFNGCSALNHASLIHDRYNVGHGQSFQLIMGDVERGDLETFDQLAQLEARFLPKLC